MKAAMAGAVASTAITMLALPRTAATDTYWTIVGLCLMPYVVFGLAATFTSRSWLSAAIVLYAVIDAGLRALRLLGPESLRNPMVVVTLPLLGAPAMVLLAGLTVAVLRAWTRSSLSNK